MKKLLGLLLLTLLTLTLSLAALPYIGVNISLAELFGRTFTALKSDTPATFSSLDFLQLKPYISGLKAPRFMYITDTGDLIFSEPEDGTVFLVPYNQPDKKQELVSGLNYPHSMDVHQGYLYIAEKNAIGRIKFNATNKKTSGEYTRIINNIPDDGGHWTRTIKFGPDGYAYVSIGSSCNVCIEKNPLRATITRFKPDNPELELFSTGLRNSVGFDWSPVDGKLYATENGRDWLGDHFPPDELNLIEKNNFYGWPYANGDRVPDPKYGKGHESLIEKSVPPVFNFGAHNAPLGITFIRNPDSKLYQQALVALHGSWNSSKKVGYKVVSLTIKEGNITSRDLITGFLKNGEVLGRPVHIVEGKHNELYLSDDFKGVIYRITQK